jgi:hypothetical protein
LAGQQIAFSFFKQASEAQGVAQKAAQGKKPIARAM